MIDNKADNMNPGKRNCSLKLLFLVISVVFLTIFVRIMYAQTGIDSSHTGKRISEIDILGNKVTKDFVILREMKSKEGEEFIPAVVEMDRRRIQSLEIFNRVSVQIVPEGNQVKIVIFVTEMWYIYPYPIFFINERDWDKLSWGAGVEHLNYRGTAEKLFASFWLGYNPTLRVKFQTPWFLSKRDLYAGLNVGYSHIRNKHYFSRNITEDHIKIAGSLGRRWGYHIFTSATIGYEEVSVKPEYSYILNSSTDTDHVPYLSLNFSLDHRDLKEFPASGYYLSLTGVKKGIKPLSVNYFCFELDSRVYFPFLSNTILALRTLVTTSFGKVPLYNKIYFGYSERIRGHFNKTLEGDDRFLFSGGLRFPLLPVDYYNLGNRPELRNLKFGISGSVFLDSGYICEQGDRFDSSLLNTGFGVGLLFHVPIVNIFRLELAFDEKGRREYIADLYVYF